MKKCIPSYGFEGRPFPRRIRRGEKGAPLRDAREPSRYRASAHTRNHCKVFTFRTQKSHPLSHKSTTRTPFSPKRMPKRCKGCHCAQAIERHRAETTRPRQGTPPGPQAPDPPFRSRHLAKAGPGGGGGWDLGPQPPPLFSSLNRLLGVTRHLDSYQPPPPRRRPFGGGGLPLPAAAAAAPF